MWEAIPTTAKPGLIAAIGRRKLDDLASDDILSTVQAYAEAASAVEDRLARIPPLRDTDILTKIIARRPSPHLWPHALRIFADSSGWRSAEDRMRALILPFAPGMTAQNVREIAKATLANEQIRAAADIPSLMERLFTLVPLGPDVLTEWQVFVDKLVDAEDGDTTAHFANPGLQARITAATSA